MPKLTANKIKQDAERARALRRLGIDTNPWRDLNKDQKGAAVALGLRIPAGHERREVAAMLGLLDDDTFAVPANQEALRKL